MVIAFFCLWFFSIQGSVQAETHPGEVVYQKWCDGCHMDSPFAPGTIQLRNLRGNAQALIETRTDLSMAYLKLIIRRGMNGMPLFRRTEINEQELDDLIRYLVSGL